MRAPLLIPFVLVSSLAALPAFAAGTAAKIKADDYATLSTTVSDYLEKAPVDTETFKDGAVVNITPVIDQIASAFANKPYSDSDSQASAKKPPAYFTQNQYADLVKAVEAQLNAFKAGERVNLDLARQAVTTTLLMAQAGTQLTNAAEVQASQRALVKAYLDAMKESGRTVSLSAAAAKAWAEARGYKAVIPVYQTKSQLDARFVNSAKPATAGGSTSSSGFSVSPTAASPVVATTPAATAADSADLATALGQLNSAFGTSGSSTGTTMAMPLAASQSSNGAIASSSEPLASGVVGSAVGQTLGNAFGGLADAMK